MAGGLQRVYATREIPGLERLALRSDVELIVGRADAARAELIRSARGAEAIICSLSDPIDRELLAALAPPLGLVATFAVGYENIDIEAAREHQVRVTHTPGVLTEATAEIAVSLLLDCARRVTEGDRLLRSGGWKGFAPDFHLGRGVYGKTLGIIGAGRIGKRVAQTLVRGFDCRLRVYSRSRPPDWDRDWEQALGATFVSFTELLAEADFVSLHCPVTPQTRHLIDAEALAQMKPTACLVNTARGAVVDQAALIRALEERRIGAAGLDVYAEEPVVPAALRALENAVLLPHIGSATHETRAEMGRLCVESVLDHLAGRPLAHAVV